MDFYRHLYGAQMDIIKDFEQKVLMTFLSANKLFEINDYLIQIELFDLRK